MPIVANFPIKKIKIKITKKHGGGCTLSHVHCLVPQNKVPLSSGSGYPIPGILEAEGTQNSFSVPEPDFHILAGTDPRRIPGTGTYTSETGIGSEPAL